MEEFEFEFLNNGKDGDQIEENGGDDEKESMVINPTSVRDRIDVRYPSIITIHLILSFSPLSKRWRFWLI